MSEPNWDGPCKECGYVEGHARGCSRYAAERPALKPGDRVVARGVAPSQPEYDVGTVMQVYKGPIGDPHVSVYWERAREVYPEDPADLELYNPTGGK